MGENEFKSSGGASPRVREGGGTRAKNHTVVITPQVAGGVRARLGSDLQGGSDSGRIGGLEDPALGIDPNWERPQVNSDLGVRKASTVTEPEQPLLDQEDDIPLVDLEEDSAAFVAPEALPEQDLSEQLIPEAEETQWGGAQAGGIAEEQIQEHAEQQAIERTDEPQGDTWDPLGLLHHEGLAEPGQEEPAGAPLEEAPLLSAEPEQQVFRPDPPPKFVRVVEEPMVTRAEAKAEEICWKSQTQLVGFLVSFDYEPTGSYLELRAGRLIVTSQPEASSNCLMLPHESVSPSHAVMRVAAGGSIQVLDQLSESGTRIRRLETGEEVLLSGDKAVLCHGDIVSFGDRNFHVCLIMGHASQA